MRIRIFHSIPFSVRLFPQPQRQEPHKGRASQIHSVNHKNTYPPSHISLPKPSPVLHTQLKDAKEHAMSYADEGEPYCILPSLGRRHSGVADRALCAQHADESDAFLFLLLRKAAVASSWPATLETSRAQLHTVLATHPGAATATRAMSSSSLSRSTSQKPTRGAASTGHIEPGHDFAAHGDLERHCGAPWFS
jgi:hypothetical protein